MDKQLELKSKEERRNLIKKSKESYYKRMRSCKIIDLSVSPERATEDDRDFLEFILKTERESAAKYATNINPHEIIGLPQYYYHNF